MAKQTFVTGQVLTAAQQNALQANDYNQTVSAKVASYVLVAADAGTRITMSNAGATTITVNTSLFTAGDTLFITNIGAGACTITAGTATVSTASSLVLAQYDSGRLYFTSTGVAIWEKYQGASGGSGLTLISTTTFSAQASQAFDNCFTSTYDTYMAIVDVYDNGVSADFRIQLRTSAPATIATNYLGAQSNLKYDGTASTNLANSATLINTGANGFASTIRNNYRFMFYKPLTTRQNVTYEGYSSGNGGSMFGAFQNTSGSAAAGFILTPASSTISGTVSIYGLAK